MLTSWDVFRQAGQQGRLCRSFSIQGATQEMLVLSWPWNSFVPTESQAEVGELPVPARLPPLDSIKCPLGFTADSS